MKKAVTLIGITIFSFLLVACSIGPLKSGPRKWELGICGTYAVPGMALGDLKGNAYSCDVIETDSEGRLLFEFSAETVLTGEKITALVICQKIDEEAVYYYENICYLFSSYEQADIDRLKEANDWGLPLDESKMSNRSKHTTADMYLQTDSQRDIAHVCSAFVFSLGVAKESIVDRCFLDADHYGHELYWISVDNSGITEHYFVVVDSGYRVAWHKVENGCFSPGDVAALKQEIGWIYGMEYNR